MKTTCADLIKRNLGPALAITAFLAPFAPLHGAVLHISGITHEQVGYKAECSTQFGGTITGAAVSTLGIVSIQGSDCITSLGNHFSFEGTLAFTTFNGDQLFADYSGLFIPTIYSSIFTLTDSVFEITSGTGSFSKATGGGTVQGVQNILSGMGLMWAQGEIFDVTKQKSKNRQGDSVSSGEKPFDLLAAASAWETPLSSGWIIPGNYYYEGQDPQLFSINAVPEPGTLGLLGIGLAGIGIIRHKLFGGGRNP